MDATDVKHHALTTTFQYLRMRLYCFPKEDLVNMTRRDWTTLTVEKYRALFKGSAVKRAKFEGLMRNIKEVEKRFKK